VEQFIGFNGTTPYVAYKDGSSGVTVMMYSSGAWVVVGSRNFSTPLPAKFITLAFNGATPYVAFAGTSGFGYVMTFDGTNWNHAGTGAIGISKDIESTSLAFNGTTPYLAYEGDNVAYVFTYNGTSWTQLGTRIGAPEVYGVSLALSGATPSVAEINAGSVVMYKYNSANSSWVQVGLAIGTSGDVSTNGPSAAFNGTTPYVAYVDATSGVTVKYYNGTGWVTVGTAGLGAATSTSATYPSLAFNGSTPYVAYANGDAHMSYFGSAPPATPASAVSFSNTTPTVSTISWTSGNGDGRAVFMYAGASGTPAPADVTAYNANAAFGSGDQIGSTGWYCVYNGTGSTVNVTGLVAGATYQTMVVEYTGSGSDVSYETAVATGNPAALTTPLITASGTPVALSTTSGTASTSTSFNVSGVGLSGNITVTAPAGFDVSPDNATWTTQANPSYTITPVSGAIASSPVYIQLDAADAANIYTGSVALTGGSATEVDETIPASTVYPVATVVSITPVGTSPTNATTLDYTVTFASALTTPPSTGDFALSGTASGTINTITTTDNINYHVNVTGVSGNGTLELDMTGGSDAVPTISNVPFTGNAYTIDQTPPIASPIAFTSNDSSNGPTIAQPGDQVTLTFTVSKPVLAPVVTIAGTTAQATTPDNVNYTASYIIQQADLPDANGNVPYSISLTDPAGNTANYASTDAGIADVALQPLPPDLSGTAPAYLNGLVGTASPSTTFTVSGDNIVDNIQVTAPRGYEISADNTNFGSSLTVGAPGTVNATLYIRLLASDTYNAYYGTIALNTTNASEVDLTVSGFVNPPPTTVLSIVPATTSPTNSTSVDFLVTLGSQLYSGLNGSDFTLTGTATGTISSVSFNGTAYDVNVSNVSGSGTLGLTFTSADGSTPTITNLPFTGGSYTIDQTAPTLTNTAYYTSNSNISWGKLGDVIHLNMAFSKPVQTPMITIDGNAVAAQPGGGNSWTASYTLTSSDTEGQIPFDIQVTDLAGNTNEFTSATQGLYVNFDMTPPTVSISAPSVTSIGNGTTGMVTYTITYADANFNTSNLPPAAVSLVTTGSANANIKTIGSGTSYTVTVSNITGTGSLGISLTGGYASDLAGNTDAAGVTTSATFSVLSSDATLSSLTLSNGTLSPAYNAANPSATYSAAVGNGAKFSITPTADNPTATITVNGQPATSGSATAVPLVVGSNTITIVVTAAAGNTQTVVLTITEAQSANDNLASVKTNAGLAQGTTVPTALTESVSNAIGSITVTPTVADPTATVTVNGMQVTSGQPSTNISLGVGSTAITIVVKAQNNVTKTYTLTVTRAASANDNLASLTLSNGTLSPAFGTATSFTAGVGNGATLTVTPTVADPTATLTINGTTAPSGAATAVTIAPGTNTITIVVTAANGATKTYTLVVTEAKSSNDNLAGLTLSNGTLSPAFGTATSFTAGVGNGATLTVTPTVADPTATLTINGTTAPSGTATAVTITPGTNTITIVVTAADNSTKTYTLVVTEAQSANDRLLSFKTSAGLAQGQTVPTTLTESVANSVSTITVTPTTLDATATVMVNNIAVTSGSPSAAITLGVGTTTITTVVTAQNGATLTYTLTVARAASANLSGLALSSGALSPVFSSTSSTYSAGVSNPTTSITVTPTAIDPNATVLVNGTTVPSGTASPSIPLPVGNTTITITVTASDNSSTLTYSVAVNRARSPDDALLSLKTSAGLAKGKTVPTTLTESVVNAVSSLTVTPTVDDPTAAVTVNNVSVTSGSPSASIPLIVGNTTITVVVTAQNGATQTYTLTVTRATGSVNTVYEPVGVQNFEPLQISDDGIMVHQGVSPNGDGINDYLQIDNISNYPDNNLKIMNRNGLLIYEAKGYDNSTRVFDGHSNKTGQMQLPGTYFYELDYTVSGVTKHKTGFLVLKY
jgi:gliding motility-associated-like protein